MERVHHNFLPVYNQNSRVLILGTMPSPKSREQGFYYGHPKNRFWPVLANLLKTAVPATIEEKNVFLLENKIALWDVVASCTIHGADDSSIRSVKVNDLSPILETADIRAIFTNGKKAAALLEKYRKNTGGTFFSLPSTSPANCRLSTDDLLEAYGAILPFLEDNF